jgi:CRISPR-associated protein Csm5
MPTYTPYTFTATPLTPIHVGSGETLDTSRYRLDGDRLVEISLARLTAHLSGKELEELTRLAEGSDLKLLRDFLHHRADLERDGIASMAVSRTFADHFQKKQCDPRNQLLVNCMTRNYQAGHGYLPGTAIKGALRTAMVSCLAEKDDAFRRVRPSDGRNLEERALHFDFQRGLEQDPFRTVKVADADLSPDATVVSRFKNVHRDAQKPESGGIEAWYERLRSRADGAEPPTFTVEIQVDAARQRHHGRDLVGRPICLDDLREAANRFYAGRFKAEWERFHARGHMNTAAALGRAFGANGAFHLPQAPAILLRVGRFSHFESLSVDHLREGHCPQARTPEGRRIKEGSTRNLCVLDGGGAVPFGWLLLTPVSGDGGDESRTPPVFAPRESTIDMTSITPTKAPSTTSWRNVASRPAAPPPAPRATKPAESFVDWVKRNGYKPKTQQELEQLRGRYDREHGL